MGLVMNRFHWLTIVGLAVHPLVGGTQSISIEKQAVPPGPASMITYHSAFEGYRGDTEIVAGDWRALNAALMPPPKKMHEESPKSAPSPHRHGSKP